MLIAPLLVSATMSLQSPTPGAAPPRGYAVAAIAVAYHPDNGPVYHRVSPALGGHSWDVSGGGGVHITPGAAIEGELMYGGLVAAPQHFSYFTSETYTERERDVLLNALVRGYADTGHRVALIAGGGIAWMNTSEVSITEIDSFGRSSPGTPRSNWTHGPTLTFGADVAAVKRAHVSLAPSVRVRLLKRPLADEGWDGLGSWTFQFGATVILR
jgi:hypothetical protein